MAQRSVYLKNAARLAVSGMVLRLLGMAQLRAEFEEFNTVMLIVMLAMGNVTFFLLDRLLLRNPLCRRKR